MGKKGGLDKISWGKKSGLDWMRWLGKYTVL